MAELVVGSNAPSFSAEDQQGQTHNLEMYRGKRVILYFYPRDSTPGCTKQACDFRDAATAIETSNAVVLGVSTDSAASHAKFSGKYDLNFPLLVDEDGRVSKAYGVMQTKKMFGKTFEGIVRSTFVIDEQGTISSIDRKVKVNGHVEGLLDGLTD